MAETLVPYIPEDAPFTSAQRAWLNGFLAGLYSYAPAEKAEPVRVAVLYGSQTGTAEGSGAQARERTEGRGIRGCAHVARRLPSRPRLRRRAMRSLSSPPMAKESRRMWCSRSISICALRTCRCSEIFTMPCARWVTSTTSISASSVAIWMRSSKRLAVMRILDRVDCDVDLDAPFAAWKQRLAPRLREVAQQPVLDTPANPDTPSNLDMTGNMAEAQPAAAGKPLGPVAVPELLHSKDNPYLSPLVEKRNLTDPASSKRTVHLEFDIADASLRYEAGDACGVAPENCPALVDEALSLLRFTGEEKRGAWRRGLHAA